MRLTTLLLMVTACGAGSGDADSSGSNAKTTDTTRKIAGVWPDKFDCNTIATPAALTELLGGTATQVDNPAAVPPGVAKPCAYEVVFAQPDPLPPDALGRPPEYWQFDMDCRESYKKTADALFEQYKHTNADRIAAYNASTDAGIAAGKPDANVVVKAPGEAHEVDVGARGLDHNDQSILFIDDDAPCYVRVNGADATRRLELARLVAKGLTYVNAPMEPRTMP